MKNHIGRTLLVLILFIHSLTSLASSQSKYTPLIRQVRGWPSEKILSKGDQFLQNKKEDKALVMYMLVCSRTNDRMTDEELTDCSLANLKVGDIDQAKHYISLCIDHAEREKMLHYIPETLRDMAQIQRKTGNATLAQQYERQYLSLMDSIYNSQRFNVVKNQQFMYEVDKTDKEITRLHQEEEIHRQNARLYQLLFLVSILAIVLVSMLLFYVVRQKRDLEASYRKLYDINRSHVETGEKKAPRATNLLKEDQKQLLLDGIRRVMEETDEYCQPEFTVATLAKLIDSNERYVSMVVNDHFGKSFTEVLNDYRIKKACERLTTNNAKYAQLTIAAIGQSVGYKSQTTFVKQFRKRTGLTPSVYQKFVAEDRRNKETGA